MIERIIDITEQPATLTIRHNNLVVSIDGSECARVPLPEVAVVLLNHPATTLYASTLSRLVGAGTMVLTTDERHLPNGMFLPLQANTAQTGRLAAQVGLSRPKKKQIWKRIVQAKLSAQADLLQELHGTDNGLSKWYKRVKSGDPDNLEAQGARLYWACLFGDLIPPNMAFRRKRHGDEPNGLLNYGYAVLRAVVARSICAAGLHPSLGVHHHNKVNPFCLADDLMEPFRPVVDRAVVELVGMYGPDMGVCRETRGVLIEAIIGRYVGGGEERKLFDHVHRATLSLLRVIEGEATKLSLPTPLVPAV